MMQNSKTVFDAKGWELKFSRWQYALKAEGQSTSSFHESEKKCSDENRSSGASWNVDFYETLLGTCKEKDSLAFDALISGKQGGTQYTFETDQAVDDRHGISFRHGISLMIRDLCKKLAGKRPELVLPCCGNMFTFEEKVHSVDMKEEGEQNGDGWSNFYEKTDGDVTETTVLDQTMQKNTVDENKNYKLNKLDENGLATSCLIEKEREVAVSNEDGNCRECLRITKDINNCDIGADFADTDFEDAPVSSCDMNQSSSASNGDIPDAVGHFTYTDDEAQKQNLVKSNCSVQVGDGELTGFNNHCENQGLETHGQSSNMLDTIEHADDAGCVEEQLNLAILTLSPVVNDSRPTASTNKYLCDSQESFKSSLTRDLKPVTATSGSEVCHKDAAIPHIGKFNEALETFETEQNMKCSINNSQNQIKSSLAKPDTWDSVGHSSETVREDDNKFPKRTTKQKKQDVVNSNPSSIDELSKERSITQHKSPKSTLTKDNTCNEKSQQGTRKQYKTTLGLKLLVFMLIVSCPELCSGQKVKMFDDSPAVFRPEKNVYSACNVTPTECPNSESDMRNHIRCLNRFLSSECLQGYYFCDKTDDGVLVEGCFPRNICGKGMTNRATFDRSTVQAGLECQVCPDGFLQRVEHDNREDFRPGCESRSISMYIRDNADIMKLVQKGNKSEPDKYICDTLQGYSNRFGFTLCSTNAECSCVKSVKCSVDKPELLPNGTCDAPCAVPRDKRNDFSCSQYKVPENESIVTTDSHKDSGQVTHTPVRGDNSRVTGIMHASTHKFQDFSTDSTKGSDDNVGPYIGGVVGFLVLSAIIGVFVYYHRRKFCKAPDDAERAQDAPAPTPSGQAQSGSQANGTSTTTHINNIYCGNYFEGNVKNLTLEAKSKQVNGFTRVVTEGEIDDSIVYDSYITSESEAHEGTPLLEEDGLPGPIISKETSRKVVVEPNPPINDSGSQGPSEETARKIGFEPQIPKNTDGEATENGKAKTAGRFNRYGSVPDVPTHLSDKHTCPSSYSEYSRSTPALDKEYKRNRLYEDEKLEKERIKRELEQCKKELREAKSEIDRRMKKNEVNRAADTNDKRVARVKPFNAEGTPGQMMQDLKF